MYQEREGRSYAGAREHFHYWRPVDLRKPSEDIKRLLSSLDRYNRLNRYVDRVSFEFDEGIRNAVTSASPAGEQGRGSAEWSDIVEIQALCRSEYGYVDRNMAYRRLKEWQEHSGWGYSLATVMQCRQWQTCSAPLA